MVRREIPDKSLLWVKHSSPAGMRVMSADSWLVLLLAFALAALILFAVNVTRGSK
jgi:hypothetical protein